MARNEAGYGGVSHGLVWRGTAMQGKEQGKVRSGQAWQSAALQGEELGAAR